MKISEISKILDVASITKHSILISGKHGIGKTDSIGQWSDSRDYHLEVLHLATIEPSDVTGLLLDDGNGGHIYTKPLWLKRMLNSVKPCVLFLDEFNRAHKDIRQASYPLLLTKTFHEHKLPDNTIVVAAINPDDGDYDVESFDGALKDRMEFYAVDCDAGDWLIWAENNGIHKSVKEFLAKNPSFLWLVDENDEKHPSPRGWKFLSDAIHAVKKLGKEDLLFSIACGIIGGSTAGVFMQFYNQFTDILSIDQFKKIVGKPKNSYAAIKEVAVKIRKELENSNSVEILEISRQLVDECFEDVPDRYTTEVYDAVPLTGSELKRQLELNYYWIVFLYALYPEQRAACIAACNEDGIHRAKKNFFLAVVEQGNEKEIAHSIIDFKGLKK